MEDVAKVPAGRARLRRPPVWLLVVELLLLVLVAALAVADAPGRPYHHVGIDDMWPRPDHPETVGTFHTHVCVSGTVGLVRREPDGDLHVRLEDPAGTAGRDFVIVEEIPRLRVTGERPRKGASVTACGVSRWDRRHRWPEVHPLEEWRK